MLWSFLLVPYDDTMHGSVEDNYMDFLLDGTNL